MDYDNILEAIEKISENYLRLNYDYAWVKAMLYKASLAKGNSTLITGSSHALNGIWEPAWENAINCSIHSQDIYYDYAVARHVIASGGRFSRCIIIMGYYIAFQDVSRSTNTRDYIVSGIYYPLLKDAHNWAEHDEGKDPWGFLPDAGEFLRKKCEGVVCENILAEGTYYSKYKKRGTYFDFGGRKWCELSPEEKDNYGKERAYSHNKSKKYKEAFLENGRIMDEYLRLLNEYGTRPLVVITPFSPEYNKYVDEGLKQGVFDMLNGLGFDVDFVDFNNFLDMFDEEDFMDTDHLSLKGAQKVSTMLAGTFGAHSIILVGN